MPIPSNLAELTTEEKLKTMELLWEELCRNPEAVPFLEWHEEILEDRRAAVARGEEIFEDWEDAKRKIQGELG